MGRSGGGGGRSSGGFGGGRSSGGFSGAGRSSRSSSSSSYRPSRSSSTYRHRTSSRINNTNVIMGPSYQRAYSGRTGSAITTIIITVFVLGLVFALMSGTNHNSSLKNTTQRQPITSQVYKTDWYEDELYWIKNKNVLVEGLEHFYNKTGIQPYVLFVAYDDVYWRNGTLNVDKANAYLDDYYNSHFKDEGHFLFAYFETLNDSIYEMEGEFRYLSGYAADSVMDNEALTILWGHFEDNYYNTSLSLEEMISNTFSKTADTIMSKPTNGWDFLKIGAIALGGVGAVYLVYRMIKTKAQREKEREEYTKEILDKPLETFGTDTSELEEKYK